MSPAPYYQDDLVTLYNGDCLDLADLWTCADVLVTDPPYGMAYESGRVKHRPSQAIANDKTTEVRDNVLTAWGDRPAIAFGKWNVERPTNVRARLIWSKGEDPGMGDLSLPWGNSDEEIYVFGSGFVGKRGSNVLVCPKPPVATRPDHPTPKPIPLMERLIEKTVGTVADPFAGSGATLLAASNLGRRSIGVELEERYCEMIAKRLANQTMTFEGMAA